jgi:RimJ/RimL family protein N-acetyltransferase
MKNYSIINLSSWWSPDQLRNEFNINKVIGKTQISNKEAIQLVKKLGFTILQTDDKEIVLVKDIRQ